MKFIVNHFPYITFNDYDLHECEKAILSDEIVKPVTLPSRFYIRILKSTSKILELLKIKIIRSTSNDLLKNPLSDSNHLFTLMIGPDFEKYFPFSYFISCNRSIYMFDAWPCHHDSIISFVLKNKIDHLFVTSLQATQTFKKYLNNTNVHWIPEAIDPECYLYSNIKTIDVLSFGRKYDRYHNLIYSFLKNNNKVYLFERIKGEVIFEKRSDFINALGNSKISICFPSNITHPERAGDIEIMTMRYLQSIVSKCLIIGKAPEEMIKLFGYNPVIDINWNDPITQIDNILKNYDNYNYLVEKNYSTVINNHTWLHRWDLIKKSFKKNIK
jgi:hypothetical protein